MTITLEPTNDWIEIDGVPCRMWDGTTATGIKVQAAIPRLAPLDDEQVPQWRAEASAAGFLPPTHQQNARQQIRDLSEQEKRAMWIHRYGVEP